MSYVIRSLITSAALAAFAGQAIASDLPSKTKPPYEPFKASQYDWSGFYTGATADYVASFKATGDLANSAAKMLNPRGNGFNGSLYAGFNKQFDSLVVGTESDLTLGRISDSRTYSDKTGSATVKFNQDVSGSVRLRVGYAFNDILVFATSGIAISQAKLGAAIKITGYSASANDTRIYTGYTVGGGLEYGLTTNLIARTEYRFTQYEKASYNTIKFGMDVQEVRAGMAYKF